MIKDDLTQCLAMTRLSVVVKWVTGPLISFSASQLRLILLVAGQDFKKERGEVPKPFRTGTIFSLLPPAPPPPQSKSQASPGTRK